MKINKLTRIEPVVKIILNDSKRKKDTNSEYSSKQFEKVLKKRLDQHRKK